jgi:hypothetical protein
MPTLILSVSHQHSQDEAMRRIQAAVTQAKAKYSDKINEMSDSWDGYIGNFEVSGKGQKASGTVAVNRSDVSVKLRLPLAALLFKSKIESGIRRELTRILA